MSVYKTKSSLCTENKRQNAFGSSCGQVTVTKAVRSFCACVEASASNLNLEPSAVLGWLCAWLVHVDCTYQVSRCPHYVSDRTFFFGWNQQILRTSKRSWQNEADLSNGYHFIWLELLVKFNLLCQHFWTSVFWFLFIMLGVLLMAWAFSWDRYDAIYFESSMIFCAICDK